MMLVVTQIQKKNKTEFRVELQGDKGEVTGKICCKSYQSLRHFEEAAKLLGVPAQSIIDAVAQERAKPVEAAPAPEASALPFSVRGIESRERTRYATMKDALAHSTGGESVIEWPEGMAAGVDIDFHGVKAPGTNRVFMASHKAVPAPSFAWETRSGGLRLLYTGEHSEALAAAGLVSILHGHGLEGFSGVELLLKSTRSPAPGVEVSRLAQGGLFDISRQFADDVDAEKVEEWCQENGYHIGQRYKHDRCLIAPEHKSQAQDPVYVTPHGVHCHSCTGRTGKGFRSFAFLLGVQVDTTLARLVRGFVHWEHARLTLVDMYAIPELILRAYYRACLLGKHGAEDPRIDSVFLPHGIVRGSGLWLTATGEVRNPERLRATIAGLPATQDKEAKSIVPVAEKFLDNVSLEAHGFEPVKLVHGMRIGTRWDYPDKRPRLVIPVAGNVPQYLEGVARLPEDEAWAAVEVAYPGANRKLIELLCVARGHTERGTVSMSPIIFLDGVSGSGKSSHIQLAAAICGDRCTGLVPSANETEMGLRLWEAFQKGSFLSIDEAAKGAATARVDQTSFLNFVLHIAPTTTYKVMYKGYAPLGGCPIVSITDIEFDPTVMSDGQLGRRAWYLSLGTNSLDWKASTAAYGLVRWSDIRGELADICGLRRGVDSLLSHWIDKWFRDSIPPLDDVAESLGIRYMNQSDPATERLGLMKSLFEAWRSYPGPELASALKKTRKGFKAFKPSDRDEGGLPAIWGNLHDSGDPFQWRRSSELSWQRATGWKYPLRIEFRPLQTDRKDFLQMKFQEQKAGKWVDLLTS